ncbi:MAG: orotidine-5'-phosphate decarboxylase [Desulfovibrio sp.]|jgi:orotidine-5'-phosphate decarboxylase|nr:orotidine-5'-phosphate decarboxylase [Desulfovibrio sp.]
MSQLVVALDMPDKTAAMAMAGRLREADLAWKPWCKVGMELFTACGPALLESLNKLGYKIFLDLKFYDIPNTVAGAVRAAAAAGVHMLTVHCQGGERMCRSARQSLDALDVESREGSLRDGQALLIGVTALTSFAPGEMPGIALTPAAFAVSLASKAAGWGLDGVVCAGVDVKKIKLASPHLRCICPGIRPQGFEAGDQRRSMTPDKAAAAGADYLVVGRPIVAAADPVVALRSILESIASQPRMT